MKKGERKSKRIVRGTSSAVTLSILIHAGLFLLAGVLVVFTVVKKQEQQFDPPKAVERPKMKLKKPKVQVKKSSRPRSTAKIAVKNKTSEMPAIDLPAMDGSMGNGLGDGLGDGFDMMPDLSNIPSPFGNKISTGSELMGYFYNFNRNRSGGKIAMNPDQLRDILYAFMKGGWKTTSLARYYRAPEVLYTPTVCVPTVMCELAPKAFGMDGAEGWCWSVIYKGKLVYPEDIRFRFWGVGDKLMAVNVEGETVLICAYRRTDRDRFSSIWQTHDSNDNTYYFGEHRARPSDWITLKAGEEKEIQVLLANLEGGLVYHILSVEVEGQEYPWTRAGGGPTFPVFKTSEISIDMQDVICANLYPGDVSLTNGPVFNDFFHLLGEKQIPVVAEEPAEPAESLVDDRAMRVWTGTDGKTLEGKFRALVGQKVILEDARRKQIKMALDHFSPADREFIELAMPPEFNINFVSKSVQVPNPPAPPWGGGTQRPLQIFDYTFGVRLRQESIGDYNHPLRVEYIAVGEEINGGNYILLDRRSTVFTPSRGNGKSMDLYGDPVELMRIAYRATAPMRGIKYGGYLVTVTDERGKVIQYKASSQFLYDHLENLRKLNRNNHFNRECIRVRPAQPNEDSRGFGAVRGN